AFEHCQDVHDLRGLGYAIAGHHVRRRSTLRQPPQSFEISSKRDFTQRRAAPMPRVSDVVSDSVWRVPKVTSLSIVALRLSGFTLTAMDFSNGWKTGVVAGNGAALADTVRRNAAERPK